MKISVIVPPARLNLAGNRISGGRYARILRKLGHRVRIADAFAGEPCDVLVALHARRSFESVRFYHRWNPSLPIVVVLTGTDLYRDIKTSARARRALELATRLVVLQEDGRRRLPLRYREKTRVIYQSSTPVRRIRGTSRRFRICVIGNLRKEKDPFRAALASRLLPVSSTATVVHLGRPSDDGYRLRVLREMVRNPRYHWVGEQPHWKARRLLAQSRLVVITSWIEGGSNVLSEALASGVPVIASRIPGLIGSLGHAYPGLFPAGDTRSLAALISRAERDSGFYEELREQCVRLAPLVSPEREARCWQRLIHELENHASPARY